MLKQNMPKSGTQASGSGVMIGRCFPDSQHGRPERHPANAGCSFLRYTYDELRTTPTSDLKTKHGLGKIANLHYTDILGATLHKEDIGKER